MTKEYDIKPEVIEFYISENDIQDSNAIHAIKQLKSARFKVSVDAFGSTSISIQSLLNIDIDTLKIDKFSLDRDSQNNKEHKFYKTIVRFAKILNYQVMSKGIENNEQLRLAQELNVDYVQGYYFTPPLNKTNILIFIKKYQNGILNE